MGRLDFDLTDPASFAYTQWSQGVGLSNSWRFDLAADGTRVAVTSWPDSGCSHVLPTPALSFVDVATGQITSSVAIPFNSNSNTLQNLYTVTFRE